MKNKQQIEFEKELVDEADKLINFINPRHNWDDRAVLNIILLDKNDINYQIFVKRLNVYDESKPFSPPMELKSYEEKTLGEKRVRASFNPSEKSTVDAIKQKVAELIDIIDMAGKCCGSEHDAEIKRLTDFAEKSFEEGAMWAVKAITAKKVK